MSSLPTLLLTAGLFAWPVRSNAAQETSSSFFAAAGALWGFPLRDGPSAVPAVHLQLGVERRDGSGSHSHRIVMEGAFHSEITPGYLGTSVDPVTRLFGLGYDMRFPLRPAASASRLAIGLRSYLLVSSSGDDPTMPELLTMPRLSYEIGIRRAKLDGGIEVGVQYLAFVNRTVNRGELTRLLIPVTVNIRF